MGLWWVLIVAAALAIGFALSTARRLSDRAQESPEQLLKRHYANGEIDSETDERRLQALRK